jgi:hypothetical protein
MAQLIGIILQFTRMQVCPGCGPANLPVETTGDGGWPSIFRNRQPSLHTQSHSGECLNGWLFLLLYQVGMSCYAKGTDP